ncbi:MAG: DUF5060 domain-containing protein [bacterium]
MNRIAISLVVLTHLALPVIRAEDHSLSSEVVPLGLSSQPISAISTNLIPDGTNRLSFTLTGPGTRDLALIAPTRTWFGFGQLNWTMTLSDGAPTNVQVLVFMKDWDYLWYQQLLPGYVAPGGPRLYSVNLSPDATAWEPCGHHALWNARTLMEPREFGIRVFLDGTGALTGSISNVSAKRLPVDTTPPTLRDVRPSAQQVPCYEKFEVTFDIPDRYANPFNPEEVSVTATVATPDGKTNTIDGFHTRDYYRTVTPTGEETLPQGPSHWKIRYAPTQPGLYHYSLHVRDAHGSASWGPGVFVARPSTHPGFVRVSKTDPRYFEFDNGNYFFPIGHNIRSPFDERFNSNFPWVKRWTEGTTAYARHFSAMHENGENMAEVWMAAWSLGLEWSPKWPGYHGVGQYNLMNAWELDRVIDAADRNGIYLNLVIHNHGKFSGIIDGEWDDNPFNKKLGGDLEKSEEYFSDPRAKQAFQQLMRYIIARWGYSPRIFAWELWSELNLTGSDWGFYRTTNCVSWHGFATTAINQMDPNRHLITTHYCSDYTSQNMDITALPGLTHSSVDAYHRDSRVLNIVDLLAGTAQCNNPSGKPVMVTEFGGASNAQGLVHLENSLHAALWSSTCIPIAGTPLFWWWGLIEEENFYPEFLAVSRFMKGEDRRDPALVSCSPALVMPDQPGVSLLSQSLKSGTRALCWIYDAPAFSTAVYESHPTISNLVARLDGMSNGLYHVEFWETAGGVLTKSQDTEAKAGSLAIPVPPFSRDIALKVRKQ